MIRWTRDVLSDEFSLDGRGPRTLRMLFFSPGALAEAWRNGQRVRYYSPLRIYIIASALFFTLTFLLGLPFARSLELPSPGLTVGTAAGEIMSRAVAGHMQTVLSLSSLLLVPLYGLWLRLLHARGPYVLVDHLVFSLYQHSALLLLVTVAWPLFFLRPPGVLAGFGLLIFAGINTLLAFRRVYPGRRWKARFSCASLGWAAAFLGLLVFGIHEFNKVMHAHLDPIFREHAARMAVAAYREPAAASPDAQRVLRTLALHNYGRVGERYILAPDPYLIADLEHRLGRSTDDGLRRLEASLSVPAANRWQVLSAGLASVVRWERGDSLEARQHARAFLAGADLHPVPEDNFHRERFREYRAHSRRVLSP